MTSCTHPRLPVNGVAQLGGKFRIAQSGVFHSPTERTRVDQKALIFHAYQLCCDSNGMICCDYGNDIRLYLDKDGGYYCRKRI